MKGVVRPVNAALLALLVITTVSGGLAFAVGTEPAAAALVAVHGAAGLGLLLLAPAKTRIARRGLRRPGRSRRVVSLVFTALVLIAVCSGLRHAISGFRTCWPRTFAGRRISAGHGGPARLVAPGRRGFWWGEVNAPCDDRRGGGAVDLDE